MVQIAGVLILFWKSSAVISGSKKVFPQDRADFR
jgi:hypothetical protein